MKGKHVASGAPERIARNQSIRHAALALLAAMAVFAAVAQSAAAAPSVNVSVGYADLLRAHANNFPTPWGKSAGVTFHGCSVGNCRFDSGSVRIVNNTGVPQRVDSVVVHIGGCTFDIWPRGVALAPGGQLIDTQTTSNPKGGCPRNGSFDSSDVHPGPCKSPSKIVPVVDVSINGTVTAYRDTGRVLTSGGIDQALCPGGPNESTQWTSIGSKRCPGSTLTLSPPSQTHRVGTPATVAGRLANSCGTGLQGASVGFVVVTGPNQSKLVKATTNSAGVASFTYTSKKTGSDAWWAGVANPAGVIHPPHTVTVKWTVPVTSLVYTGRAYGLSIGLLGGSPLFESDTGDITTPFATDSPHNVATVNLPPVTATAVHADVTTGSGVSTATSHVAVAAVGSPGVPAIEARGVETTSTSSCSGSSGMTRIASLTIGGKLIDVNNLKPNSVIAVGSLLKVTLNEQAPVPGADHGLLVNAIHVVVPNVLDVVISSSRSDIHHC